MERSNGISQNWNEMRLSQRCSCSHWFWRGNLILTILSCENPLNICEMNYGLPMCGVNKLMGKMELVLLRDEWISLFSHGTFQRYVFVLSTRFVRTSGKFVSKKIEPFSLRSTSRGKLIALVMMLQYIHYWLEESTPLVTGVKSYIYTSPSRRNYAVSYWRKIFQYTQYRLEEITPSVTSVRSYI